MDNEEENQLIFGFHSFTEMFDFFIGLIAIFLGFGILVGFIVLYFVAKWVITNISLLDTLVVGYSLIPAIWVGYLLQDLV